VVHPIASEKYLLFGPNFRQQINVCSDPKSEMERIAKLYLKAEEKVV